MSNLGKKAKLLCMSLILSLMLVQSPVSWALIDEPTPISTPIPIFDEPTPVPTPIPIFDESTPIPNCDFSRCLCSIFCKLFPMYCPRP